MRIVSYLLGISALLILIMLSINQSMAYKQYEYIDLDKLLSGQGGLELDSNLNDYQKYEYKVTKIDGVEQLFDVYINYTNYTSTDICFVFNPFKVQEILRSKSSDITPAFKAKIGNFTVPDRFNITISKSKIQIDRINTDTFCYDTINDNDDFIKFGDSSIEITRQTVYYPDGFFYQTRSEPDNYTHLQINTTGTYNPYANLVLYLNFDYLNENNTNISRDWSNNDLDATKFINASIHNYSASVTPFSGNSLNLYPKSGSYMSIPVNNKLNFTWGDNFTVMAWVNKRATGVAHRIVDKGTNGYFVGIASSSSGGCASEDVSVGATGLAQKNCSNVSIGLAVWTHVAVVFTRNTSFIYINSVDKTGQGGANPNATIKETASELLIGRQPTVAAATNFSIDELMIFNRTLNATEINGIYTNQTLKFYPIGYYSPNYTINFTGNYTAVNISLSNFSNYLERQVRSNISLSLGWFNGSWQYTDRQNITLVNTNYTYNINESTTNITLNFTFIQPSVGIITTPILNGFVTASIFNNVSGGAPPVTSCTYTSGNWVIQCSDNCALIATVNVNKNNVTITGLGTLRGKRYITNYTTRTVNLNCRVIR